MSYTYFKGNEAHNTKDEPMTPRQKNAMNKIFAKGRISDATISVSGDIIVVEFPEGRIDKLRITETGMMLGHWKHI